MADFALVPEADLHAFDQQLVKGPVVDHRLLTGRALDTPDDLLDDVRAGRGGDVRVEPVERRPQPTETARSRPSSSTSP